MEDNIKIWARLGVTMNVTKPELAVLLEKNSEEKPAAVVSRIFDEGRVCVCGDSYIPSGEVDRINSDGVLGTDPVESGDYDIDVDGIENKVISLAPAPDSFEKESVTRSEYKQFLLQRQKYWDKSWCESTRIAEVSHPSRGNYIAIGHPMSILSNPNDPYNYYWMRLIRKENGATYSEIEPVIGADIRSGCMTAWYSIPDFLQKEENTANGENVSSPASAVPIVNTVNDDLTFIQDFIHDCEGIDYKEEKQQLRALWTAYCLRHKLDVDTRDYDMSLRTLFDTLEETHSGAWRYFDEFDEYMCKYLV